MELHVLGTRGNIQLSAKRHASHSGALLDRELMLDIGERRFLRYRHRWILITHLHPDHAFFVRAPTSGLPPVYAPETPPGSHAILVKPGQVLHLDGWRITAMPATHSEHVRSLAYRVDRGGKSLLYTGDLIDIRPGYHRLLHDLDLVITAGSFLRRGGLVRKNATTGKRFGHAGLPELIAFFAEFTPRFLVVHLGSWFYHNPRRARARVGWDGMRLRL